MSAVSMPVSRPAGRALLVASPASRAAPLATLREMGFICEEIDDPFAAMAELCRRPLAYRALVISLASTYPEELQIIAGVKRRFANVEIWLTHTDGRQSALAEAMRLGADGLLSDEGLYRTSSNTPYSAPNLPTPPQPTSTGPADHAEILRETEPVVTDPVLSAEELRALLQEPAANPHRRRATNDCNFHSTVPFLNLDPYGSPIQRTRASDQ